MPNQSNDAAIRAQLHTDVAVAWPGLTKILDDAEITDLPKTLSDLPYAVINMGEIDQTPAGLRWVAQQYPFQIIGVFARPQSGTLRAAQTTKANALLAILTAIPSYTNICRTYDIGVSYEPIFDPQETVYNVGVSFTPTVIDSFAT